MAELPIDNGFWAKSGDEVLFYSPASDSIHVFEDPKFNRVSYWNEERKTMTWQFMGQAALDSLHEAGLPHTFRDSMTQAEYDAWVDWTAENEAADIDIELDELLNGN